MNILPETSRKPLRLAKYDYNEAGFYYVTLCTHGRLCLFGEIQNGKMILNEAGKLMDRCWRNLPNRINHIIHDVFVVMPNHIHGIIIIEKNKTGTTQRSSPTSALLPSIIKTFKTYTTWAYMKGVFEHNWTPFDQKLWQRSFYEHIIRNETALLNIQQYINDNPLNWHLDNENPTIKL